MIHGQIGVRINTCENVAKDPFLAENSTLSVMPDNLLIGCLLTRALPYQGRIHLVIRFAQVMKMDELVCPEINAVGFHGSALVQVAQPSKIEKERSREVHAEILMGGFLADINLVRPSPA